MQARGATDSSMTMDGASSARLLEILSDCFTALEAVAYSSIKLSRYVSECEMALDVLVAERCWNSWDIKFFLCGSDERCGKPLDIVIEGARGKLIDYLNGD